MNDISEATRHQSYVPSPQTDEPMIALRHLEAGVRDGIISTTQLDALLARAASDVDEHEIRHGPNAVIIAYWIGALAVLFALGWFLFNGWSRLGPAGVLTVSAAYAALFHGSSRWLATRRYRLAASFTTFLVVAMVPAITWSVIALLGLWYERPSTPPPPPTPAVAELTRWIPIDLVTLVASLVALRRTRFALLSAAASVAFWYLALHVAPLVFDASTLTWKQGWTDVFVGACLIAVGFAIMGRGETRQDFSMWPFTVGLVALGFATLVLWPEYRRVVPHAMLVGSLVSLVVAVRARRREFLVAGVMGAIGYLAWLAFDVFARTLGFPIVLAGFGLAVILLAVWIQRRYPSLVRGRFTEIPLATRTEPVGRPTHDPGPS